MKIAEVTSGAIREGMSSRRKSELLVLVQRPTTALQIQRQRTVVLGWLREAKVGGQRTGQEAEGGRALCTEGDGDRIHPCVIRLMHVAFATVAEWRPTSCQHFHYLYLYLCSDVKQYIITKCSRILILSKVFTRGILQEPLRNVF